MDTNHLRCCKWPECAGDIAGGQHYAESRFQLRLPMGSDPGWDKTFSSEHFTYENTKLVRCEFRPTIVEPFLYHSVFHVAFVICKELVVDMARRLVLGEAYPG